MVAAAKQLTRFRVVLGIVFAVTAFGARAQSFRVQCPPSTITHPSASSNNGVVPYASPSQYSCSAGGTCTCSVPGGCGLGGVGSNNAGQLIPLTGYVVPTNGTGNGGIRCQQISGGDGYSTMADGTQTYMFSFGPLSGLADIAAGKPGTEPPNVFNTVYQGTVNPGDPLLPGDPATTDGASDSSAGYNAGALFDPVSNPGGFKYNGAVGLMNDLAYIESIWDISEGCTASLPTPCTASPTTVTVVLNAPSSFKIGDQVVISGTGAGYDNTPAIPSWTVTAVDVPNTFFQSNQAFQFTANVAGLPSGTVDPLNNSTSVTAASLPGITGKVETRPIIDVGVMNGNIPAPLMAFDEDDEFFLTLTNVGMIMRPDLFEMHTVHFHGYPNASSFYDGVPDASVAINIGGSFTYYYLAPDAGTYFWHCHITPPEHLQMGMVGQLYVRPRQNRVPAGGSLYAALQLQDGLALGQGTTSATVPTDLRTVCNPSTDILCSTNVPAATNLDTSLPGSASATRPGSGTLCSGAAAPAGYTGTPKYVYNDGDGSTCYDVEYPIQMHGFDPNFHFVGMTFNPEAFVDMKDKYFLLNGRSYPDTVNPGPQATQSSDGRVHYSQPMNAIINIPQGGKAALRLVNLSVSEYHTLGSLGIPMHVIGYNAKLLRDQAGNNQDYYTNSITLGGGESLDVIIDASDETCGKAGCAATNWPSGSVFYVYTPMLDHLSNSEENFGGMMTEVHIN